MSLMRRFLIILIALLAQFAVQGVAVAASFQIEPGGSITATSSRNATFSAGEGAESSSVTCALTLLGTFVHGTITKTTGTTIGSITGLRWGSCSGGEIEAVLNLPWRLTYNSILGTLPEGVTGMLVTINGMALSFSVFIGFFECLYRGDVGALIAMTRTTGSTYSTGTLITLFLPAMSLISGFGCSRTLNFHAAFGFTQQRLVRI